MSSRYEENRFRTQDQRIQNQRIQDQRTQNQRTQNQRVQNQRYQSEDVRKAPYQPGDIQRRQQAVRDAQRRRPVNDIRAQRYQQETLAGDWQQDWNRTPYDNRNDKRFTSGQFLLVLIIITLILALAGMAMFWYTGRSSLRNQASGMTAQQSSDQMVHEDLPDDNIVILDIDSNE